MAGSTEEGWMRELDCLRAFAILGIVLVHVSYYADTIGQPSPIPSVVGYLSQSAHFSVPLFFLISGFVLTTRYFSLDRPGAFYRRRFALLIPPYLVFSTLYLAYGYLALGQTSWYHAAWSVVLFNASGLFWFLAVIVQLYLLFPLLAAWLARLEFDGAAWRLPAYAAVIYAAWWGSLYQVTAGLLNAAWQPVPDLGHIVADRFFPGYLLFFVLGMYLGRDPARTAGLARYWGRSVMVVPALAMALGLQLLRSGFWWSMLVVPFSLIAFALLYRLSSWLTARKWTFTTGLEAIGRYSFGLYLVHVLIMTMVADGLIAFGLGAREGAFYVVLFASTVLLSLAVLFAMNLLPHGGRVTGIRADGAARKKAEGGVKVPPAECGRPVPRTAGGDPSDERSPRPP